jgi:glucose/arabinose dehydrogenase
MMPCKRSAVLAAFLLAACGGGSGSAGGAPASAAPQAPGAPAPRPLSCTAASNPASPGPAPQPVSGLSVPPGFSLQAIASVRGAREIAVAPNGDLFVGTGGTAVYIVQSAEGNAGSAHVFADVGDSPAAGVAFSAQNCTLYIGAQRGVYRVSYSSGEQQAQGTPQKIASVRPNGSSGHSTTSVAVAGNTLYASVGSSCDACTESDPTRATIQQMGLDGSGMTARAVRIRNAIALAVNPQTGTLWAGDAGQDSLPTGHPFELFDGVTLHGGVADYGWPDCEENRHAYRGGANCSNTVVSAAEFPAYSTAIGAAFYPANPSGAYAFPSQYRGGAFVALHGSWHTPNDCNVAPRLAFVAMNGDTPQKAVDWADSQAQWSDFISGFQPGCGAATRIGRPVGVAVGPQGSLFVADELTGAIYRIRPR